MSRSLFTGFACWHRGERDDGSDSFAEGIDTKWSDFRIGILTLTEVEKSVGSRAGCNAPLKLPRHAGWPERAGSDFERLQRAIQQRDFDICATAEANALEMHATMREALPPWIIFYRKPERKLTASNSYVQKDSPSISRSTPVPM